ncbi:MAG: hypothetical protein KJ995_08120, partial [Candidatus Omnitrophica bacterium]|nr:hypothetical protein [Candidatus Omnitrophota bacterium]
DISKFFHDFISVYKLMQNKKAGTHQNTTSYSFTSSLKMGIHNKLTLVESRGYPYILILK